uniref:MHC class II beta chain N-terminal domain-containing protein n=1 Tax=Tetraodon nigroviridis TaxID=99883 RepID=H3C150_TETNG
MASSALRVSLLFLGLSAAGGFEHYEVDLCDFTSAELKDIEYSRSLYYNKHLYARFSSSVGTFVGFTKYGLHQADYWNNQSSYLDRLKEEKQRYCHRNIQNWYSHILSKSEASSYLLENLIQVIQVIQVSRSFSGSLTFFSSSSQVAPPAGGHAASHDVTSTDELADGDWFYQLHSHLEYTPRSGEKISCVVEHASLKTPLVKDWDPSMPEAERNQIAIGASGLILGLILSLAGFIYFQRKSRGRILVPTN